MDTLNNTMKACDDPADLMGPVVDKYPFFSRPIARQLDFYLTSSITETENYSRWLDALSSLSENDIVNVHINCYGGLLDTSLQLFTAFTSTPAQVNMIVEGACCSGASLILMAATGEVSFAPFSYVMIHALSGAMIGKFHEMGQHHDFEKPWFNDVAKRVYEGFLTEEEITSMLEGKDFWIPAEEASKRYGRLAALKQKEQAEAMKQQKAAQAIIQKQLDELFNDKQDPKKPTKESKKIEKKTTSTSEKAKSTKKAPAKKEEKKTIPEKVDPVKKAPVKKEEKKTPAKKGEKEASPKKSPSKATDKE